MKKPGEYAGYLKITAMAFVIKSPIDVYQVRGTDLYLLARLPTEAYGSREPVHIAYTTYLTSMAPSILEQCWRMLSCWETQLMMTSRIYP